MVRGRSFGTFNVIAVFAVLLLGFATIGATQEAKEVASPGTIHDRFIFSFGYFLPQNHTRAVISSPDHEGTGVDLEEDLGFKAHDDVFRFDGLIRLSKRHQIGFTWFTLDRSSAKTIEKDIIWDDYRFNVGATVDGHFDFDLYKVRYRYMILQGERMELGIGGGISYMVFDFGVAGKAWISDGDEEKLVDAAWSKSPGFPVPAIGADVRWAILGNLFLGGNLQYVRGSYNHQETRYSDFACSLAWFPWRNVGFGVMYNIFKITYEDHGEHFTGRFDYSYKGPVIALNVIF